MTIPKSEASMYSLQIVLMILNANNYIETTLASIEMM